MSKPIYLISGATGDTGGEALAALLKMGHKVRAFVHREDERSAMLAAAGAEIFVGELDDFTSVRKSLEGIHAAYFVYPIIPGIIQASTYFAQAAKEAKVKHVVNMSQISARREATSTAALNHWLAEEVFNWSGLSVTHIRPTFFSEWLLYYAVDMKKGFIRLPFSTGRHAPISAHDQGQVIAHVLNNFEAHRGKVYPLYGDEEYSFPELIALAAKIFEHKIKYEQISYNEFEEDWTKRGRAYLGQHLKEVAKDHTAGVFAGTNTLVKEITGARALQIEDFLAQHRAEFQS